MAAEISEAFGVESELIPGGSGIYDVVVDGEMIFSKHRAGRFPDAGEIASSLRAMQAG